MKLAACLALALAVTLGIWTVVDYAQNERQKQLVVRELQLTIVTGSSELGNHAHRDLNEVIDAERFDGIIGIAAAVIVITSAVLFSKNRVRKGE
jgi:hypothetical protein